MSSNYFNITDEPAPSSSTTSTEAPTSTTPPSTSSPENKPTPTTSQQPPLGSQSSTSAPLPTAALVGIGVGVGIVVITCAVCGFLYLRHLRKQQKLLLAELHPRTGQQPGDGAGAAELDTFQLRPDEIFLHNLYHESMTIMAQLWYLGCLLIPIVVAQFYTPESAREVWRVGEARTVRQIWGQSWSPPSETQPSSPDAESGGGLSAAALAGIGIGIGILILICVVGSFLYFRRLPKQQAQLLAGLHRKFSKKSSGTDGSGREESVEGGEGEKAEEDPAVMLPTVEDPTEMYAYQLYPYELWAPPPEPVEIGSSGR
ncbi:hypothetical protein VTK26DRAFT_1552 [Humicola hyalothermophila]